MDNCLVTKLKGVVGNDTLPLFKTIRINLIPNGGTGVSMLIGTGDQPVTITSKVPFHYSSATGDVYTTRQIPANRLQVCYFVSSEVGAGKIDNAVLMSGGIYSMTAFAIYRNTMFTIADVDKESMLCSDNLIADTCSFGQRVKPEIQVLCIQDFDEGRKDYSSMIPADNNIRFLNTIIGQDTHYLIINVSSLQKMPKLEQVYARVAGSIIDLPLSVNALLVGSINTTGSLNDFAEDRRSKGKVSGYLAISVTGTAITYNGTKISELDSSVVPINSSNMTYFVWTPTTMGFTDTAPDGLNVYSSPYWAAKAILDGEW